MAWRERGRGGGGVREKYRVGGRIRKRGMKEAEVLDQHCAEGRKTERKKGGQERGGEKCSLHMFGDE